MAKQSFTDAAGTLQKDLNGLLERLSGAQSGVSDLLSAVKTAERTLMEKEEEAARARLEREREERLREMYASDKEHAAHIGGVDLVSDEETSALIAAKAAEKAPSTLPQETPPQQVMPEPAPQPLADPEPVRETVTAAHETPAVQEKQPAAPVADEAVPVATPQAEKPEPAPAQQQPAAKAPQARPAQQQTLRPAQQPAQTGQPAQGGQGSYTARPIQQQGGNTARPPQQGGYTARPPQQGGYAPRPQQGGYTARPPQQGGYAPRPQQGGYTARPPQQGGYNARPQQGGYAPRPQQGGYAPRPQQGGYAPRPQQGGYAPRPSTPAAPVAASGKERVSNYDPNRSAYTRTYDSDKKTKNKKAIQRETAPDARGWDEDSPAGSRRPRRGGKQQVMHRPEPVVIEKAVITTDTITVKDLSEKIGKPAAQIIKKLFMLGIMATINQEVDFDTCELIANDYGIELEKRLSKSFEEVLADSSDDTDAPEKLVARPPVVTIMGHVDHGKTSLLDAIRDSSITEGEAGGITQHIGAYTVQCKGRTITFIDTPGHEAFTSMRARGAQVTDIVILVVAADDGIMPQTVEAINHAKAAGVPIIVAINKMDKPAADPDRVKQQLTEYGLVSEEWGGETICVPVSAKTQLNLDLLLEMVLLQADVLELTANPDRLAKGAIIEAKLDKGRGPIATVLVQNGTLRKGDTIVAGTTYGRIRAMMDDRGRVIDAAGPSTPVEILGFNEVPDAGDTLNVAEIDKLSRQVAEERRDKIKAAQLKNLAKVSLDELFTQMAEGELKDLNIIVKADVQGSVEAVKQALEKLSNEEVRVRCIHGGVGAITGSDIMFASASNAIVIGFNVRPDSSAKSLAEKEKVDVRTYRIIYNAIEDVQNAMKGMFKPVFTEVELGRISVRSTFKVSGVGTIAGAYVQDGKVTRSAQVRVVRDGIVVHEGKIASLKRFKDDAREVAAGYECGIGIENFNDVQEGDTIEAFIVEEVKK